jgi:hypothetical protein
VRAARSAATASYAEYEKLADDIPDELVDELVSMLEAEAARRKVEISAPQAALEELFEEIGFGRSPRELHWAAWGFAAGFALNVGLAKYAQMTTSASMSEFVMPLLFGGVLAGSACAAIGWGLAKLREH